MSNIPRSPGRYACRHSVTVNGVTDTAWIVIGKVVWVDPTNEQSTLEFRGGSAWIQQHDFNQFDWHRIELPEGWE